MFNNVKKFRPESAIQFEDIYEKHNSVEERAKRKLIKNREERAETIKADLGL